MDYFTGYKPLILNHIHYEVNIESSSAIIKLTQHYKNTESVPVDVGYSFPINNDLIFYDFQAEFEGKVIRGELLNSKKADQFYIEQATKGNTVSQIKIDPNTKDILRL
jgi:Vault protein inter-alpha-trypsin domain